MPRTIAKQVSGWLEKVPIMDLQGLRNLRTNASRFGSEAAPLVAAIDERIAELDSPADRAVQRLDFARAMLRLVDDRPAGEWVASRDLFERAQVAEAGTAFVVWMSGNGARKIPITKALETVLPEFPHLERRKEGAGQSDRVYYRRRPA